MHGNASAAGHLLDPGGYDLMIRDAQLPKTIMNNRYYKRDAKGLNLIKKTLKAMGPGYLIVNKMTNDIVSLWPLTRDITTINTDIYCYFMKKEDIK